jgi:hypothetical protein
METILVSVCASVGPNKSREIIQNGVVEANFHVFRYNFACRPSILILKILAEPQGMPILNLFCFFRIFASKGFKSS